MRSYLPLAVSGNHVETPLMNILMPLMCQLMTMLMVVVLVLVLMLKLLAFTIAVAVFACEATEIDVKLDLCVLQH